jgi:hypothetical protein
MTITEALAEIKTILKRLESKREFVRTYQFRVDSLKDPLEKDGGSAKAVAEANQAISDLELRIVQLRMAIQHANEHNHITVEGVEKPISDWLVWRREIAPGQERFVNDLAQRLLAARQAVTGQKYKWGNEQKQDDKPVDIVVNIDEAKLSADKEKIKNILGTLDGQLSLKNATIQLLI